MSKKVDNSNIAETITEMTGKKAVVKSENSFDYLMPKLERLYNLLQPALTTVESNNVIFINSSELISDNAYYLQLIDYYHNASPTFSALIDLRRNMLTGEGLIPTVQQTLRDWVEQNFQRKIK